MLPIGQYNFYVGIDPGNHGAFGVMNAEGTVIQASTMPAAEDLGTLRDIFKHIARLPNAAVGIEWPTAWPHSFGNAVNLANIFGQGMGRLEAMAFLHVGPEHYFKVPPQLWKARLGLDGKTIEGANDRAAALFDVFYPESAALVRGPRGGILDGPLDALLIAHLMRTRGGTGMQSIVDKFGKDSVEAFAFVMGGARRKRKFVR